MPTRHCGESTLHTSVHNMGEPRPPTDRATAHASAPAIHLLKEKTEWHTHARATQSRNAHKEFTTHRVTILFDRNCAAQTRQTHKGGGGSSTTREAHIYETLSHHCTHRETTVRPSLFQYTKESQPHTSRPRRMHCLCAERKEQKQRRPPLLACQHHSSQPPRTRAVDAANRTSFVQTRR